MAHSRVLKEAWTESFQAQYMELEARCMQLGSVVELMQSLVPVPFLVSTSMVYEGEKSSMRAVFLKRDFSPKYVVHLMHLQRRLEGFDLAWEMHRRMRALDSDQSGFATRTVTGLLLEDVIVLTLYDYETSQTHELTLKVGDEILWYDAVMNLCATMTE